MTINNFFGDWMNVIDEEETKKVIIWLKTLNPNNLCPSLPNIFKAFRLCSYKDCRVVMVGLDPYPQKGVATGVLFGNKKETLEENLSPSLKIIKESAINYEIFHNFVQFDNTLESWAKQGILMINSALTCEANKIGSHTTMWIPFIVKLLKNLSKNLTGLIYVLFGKQAQLFKPCISSLNDIIEVEHPSYFARTNKIMPYRVFIEINELLLAKNGETIKWYNKILDN